MTRQELIEKLGALAGEAWAAGYPPAAAVLNILCGSLSVSAELHLARVCCEHGREVVALIEQAQAQSEEAWDAEIPG